MLIKFSNRGSDKCSNQYLQAIGEGNCNIGWLIGTLFAIYYVYFKMRYSNHKFTSREGRKDVLPIITARNTLKVRSVL